MEVSFSVGLLLVATTLTLAQQPRSFREDLAMEISPDGTKVGLRVRTEQGFAFRLIDHTNMKVIWTVPKVTCFAFGQSEVFTLDESGLFRVHDWATGAVRKTSKLVEALSNCAINSTGTVAAVARVNAGFRIAFIDIATAKTLRELERFLTVVYAMKFSPDERWLATGEFNRVARLWDVSTGVEQETFRGHLAWVGALSFSKNGRCLVTSSYGGFYVWELVTGKLLQTLSEPAASIQPLPITHISDGRIAFLLPQDELALESQAAVCSEPPKLPSTLRVLVIGISEYNDPRHYLPAARSDAAAVGSLLTTRTQGWYNQVAPIRLYDRTATRAGIEAAFERLTVESHPEDIAVIFFAGHGVDDGMQFYLVPSDVSVAAPGGAGFSTAALAKAIERIPARKKLLIVDACQLGGSLSKLAAAIPKNPDISVHLIASSLASALEVRRLGHGILTHVLLRELGNRPLTAVELIQVVKKMVPRVSGKYFPARPQQVATLSRGKDFPLIAGGN